VDEAIENGVGDGWIADDLVPAIDRHLAGNDCRAALVTVLDDLEEVAPLIVAERFGSPIIEDEEVDPFERVQQPRCYRWREEFGELKSDQVRRLPAERVRCSVRKLPRSR
jgi:hypothetical protein